MLSAFVYMAYPGLKPVDVIFGILFLGLAAAAILVRQKLANYKTGAPKTYLSFLILSLALNFVYGMLASPDHRREPVQRDSGDPDHLEHCTDRAQQHLFQEERASVLQLKKAWDHSPGLLKKQQIPRFTTLEDKF